MNLLFQNAINRVAIHADILVASAKTVEEKHLLGGERLSATQRADLVGARDQGIRFVESLNSVLGEVPAGAGR